MFLWNLLLALVWGALNGQFNTTNLFTGFVLGYGVLWLSQPIIGRSGYFSHVARILRFGIFFLKELLVANLRLAYEVITPKHYMSPAVIAVPLDIQNETAITLLANLITLTPGTLSVDVSPDRRVLYIHATYAPDLDKVRQETKADFERRLQEVLR